MREREGAAVVVAGVSATCGVMLLLPSTLLFGSTLVLDSGGSDRGVQSAVGAVAFVVVIGTIVIGVISLMSCEKEKRRMNRENEKHNSR